MRTPATQATRDMHDRWTRRYLDHPSLSATTENTNHQQKASTMQPLPEPASGDKLEYKPLLGELLYFRVKGIVSDVVTQFGTSDVVAVDAAVLTGGHKGDTYENAYVFPVVLQQLLRPLVGHADPTTCGRLRQLPATPGKSGAWTIEAPSADDIATAEKYEAYVAAKAAEVAAPF